MKGTLNMGARTGVKLFAGVVLALTSTMAAATHVGEDLSGDQQLVASTDRLLGALRGWENAAPAAKAQRAELVVQLAQQRRARLLELLTRNPRVAASRLMPEALRNRLPDTAKALVERDVQVTGQVFAQVADDFERGVSRRTVHMQTSNSAAVLTLHLGDPAGAERDVLGWLGRDVRLAGSQLDGHVIVKDRTRVHVLSADGSTTSANGSTTPTITPVVTGDQKTLVVLANFSDSALSCSATDVQARVFAASGSSVNTSFRESSRNLVSFSGQVVGPFTVPYTSTGSCDYTGWASAADQAARAAGVDLTQYRRISYVTPRNGTCGWSGLAYMPGTRSWVQSCSATGVYTHELGHNLSLHHAATPTSEYGDGSDPMGGARNVRNNAANQVMAGWTPTGSVQDVGVGGSYAVEGLGPTSTGVPQTLRIAKPDTAETYYVSMRVATGLDAGLPSTALNTLSVHRASGRLPAKTYLLQYVGAGQTFSDAVNGIQITNQGVSGGVATVGIAFSGGTCERSAPTLAVSPSSRTASPGNATSYTLTVSNRNSAACGTSAFGLAQALPSGLSGTMSAASLSIAAGGSASATWTVSSASTIADGTYGIDATVKESTTAGVSTTGHATFIVYRDAEGPSLNITSPAEGAVLSGRSVTLSASVSDPGGVAAIEFYAGSRLLARDTTAPYSVKWNLRNATKGPTVILVRAFDTSGNVTERSINVTVP